MKGVVFTTFNEMVEEELGLEAWERLLAEVDPASGGIYTSVEEYEDDELMSMVASLSRTLDKPAGALVEHFGYYLFGTLAKKYPEFVRDAPDLFTFLESIDGVIHKEVRKLYHNPHLPSIETRRVDGNTLQMIYRSPRKLCQLATGLIKGAADSYQREADISHDVCMHDGAPHCDFTIRLT